MITPGMFVFVSGRSVTFVKKFTSDDITHAYEQYIRHDCVLSGVAVATFTTVELSKLLQLDLAFFISPHVDRLDSVTSVIVRADDICVNKKQFSIALTKQISADNIQTTKSYIAWGNGFFVVSYELGDVRALNKDETLPTYTEPGEIICV